MINMTEKSERLDRTWRPEHEQPEPPEGGGGENSDEAPDDSPEDSSGDDSSGDPSGGEQGGDAQGENSQSDQSGGDQSGGDPSNGDPSNGDPEGGEQSSGGEQSGGDMDGTPEGEASPTNTSGQEGGYDPQGGLDSALEGTTGDGPGEHAEGNQTGEETNLGNNSTNPSGSPSGGAPTQEELDQMEADAEKFGSIDLDDDVKQGWQGAMGASSSAEIADRNENMESGGGSGSVDDEHKVDGSGNLSLPDEPTDLDAEDEVGEKFSSNHGNWNEYTEQVEGMVQKVAYSQNDGEVGSQWTPEKVGDRHIANKFGLMVSKLAEDQSYDKQRGDAYWDVRDLMRRQITKQDIHSCKHDYDREKLALLIDTSPSCADEAIFYSKIAYGAMIRNDIDLYCAPNGRIDGKFDFNHMRFVLNRIRDDWRQELEGRIVLFFSDWDGTSVLMDTSQYCSVYWFDNVHPDYGIDGRGGQAEMVKNQFNGRHFYCPDKDSFLRLARKIRP